ncbi:hypothetical protein NP493_1282g00059 [Ridgeia piscesae]|uniref:Uncharacterized protein n=1 Tax=Ridgeia piscesae TaxID=27915 RepID=A0AAD9K958_RIDPI|nr:hypothetical protein NP493_1282g00059 [Ridgeia piscesae]
MGHHRNSRDSRLLPRATKETPGGILRTSGNRRLYVHRRVGKAGDALAQLQRISERRTLRSRRRSMDAGQLALDASLVPTGQGLVVSLRALEETVRSSLPLARAAVARPTVARPRRRQGPGERSRPAAPLRVGGGGETR